jgi:stalled ribosome rescue protein Dom34
MTPKVYRRGYPVAMLVGLDEKKAVFWRVYSHVVKPEKTLYLDGYRGDQKAVYNFHESIVDALRPAIKEGVKSILISAPLRTSFAADFLHHVRSHHTWLVQGPSKASFAEIAGAAITMHDVTTLTRTNEFQRIVAETTTEETENLLELLEKRLNTPSQESLVLYSFEDIENKILGSWTLGKPKPEFLMLAETFLSSSRQRNRLQRLMQIATNRGVKTRVVKAKTSTGKRLLQLGGIVCILGLY